MYGYDSPEMKPSKKIPEAEREIIKQNARIAKKRIEDLILDKCVYLYCMEFDKYGRLLGNIKLDHNDEKTVNDIMINEGYGYPYYGDIKQ